MISAIKSPLRQAGKPTRIFAGAALAIVLCSHQLAALAQTAGETQACCLPAPPITADTIADIVKKVAASVVNVVTSSKIEPEALAAASPRQRNEAARRMRRYFGMDSGPGEEALRITGSGTVLQSDGLILTSLHVVENADSITVTLKDGRSFPAKVTARDPFCDLAVLKIAAHDLSPAVFGDATQMQLGDWVIAIGNQFGLGHTVTQGIISGLGREAKGFEKSFGARTGQLRFLQTDAPINPGSSGGPLLNLKGEVIGINTFIRDDAQNIAFAVPSNIAKDVADKLISQGAVVHPYIGIVMKEPDAGRASEGVEITEVKLRSPAAQAGMVPGDVVVELDEKPVASSDDISLTVAKHNVGETIKFKVRRNGQERELHVRVDSLPENGD